MRSRVLFLSHGGGPLPLLGDAGHTEMVESLKQISEEIERPGRILVISAHWETQRLMVTSNPEPSLLYDYYGFPDESYDIEYPCQGDTDLASSVKDVLNEADISCEADPERGLDHGVFVPLKIMYPEADISCVQLSLQSDLDPEEHIVIGEALREIDQEGLLIVGSGFSFHNMKAFFKVAEGDQQKNIAFDDWLVDTIASDTIEEPTRRSRLIDWRSAPAARFCHPREEHLMPLHVCYGYAGSPAEAVYSMAILNKRSSAFLW